jgi:hypothetical protein
MVERKATKSAAAKATPKKAATKKAAASKKDAIFVDAVNAGFRAGDVYEALHAAGEAKTVEELVKLTGKSEVEVLLGIGWLLKEGKLKGDGGKVVLA